jgi:hypothetical protein
MFDFAAIPWLGVLICMIVAIVSGSLWFGPKTFFPFGGRVSAKLALKSPVVAKTWAWCLG